MVYFVQAEVVCFIKIGFTDNLPQRLRGIQTDCPHPITVLCTLPGGREEEGILHRRFAEYRHNKEWFRPGARIIRFLMQSEEAKLAYLKEDPLLPSYLREAERLCDEAPPGPWFNCGSTIDDGNGLPFARSFSERWCQGVDDDVFLESAEFIAGSRTLLPVLLAEVKRLRPVGPTTADQNPQDFFQE